MIKFPEFYDDQIDKALREEVLKRERLIWAEGGASMSISLMEERAKRFKLVEAPRELTIGELKMRILENANLVVEAQRALMDLKKQLEQDQRDLEKALIKQAELEGKITKIERKTSKPKKELPEDFTEYWESLSKAEQQKIRSDLAKKS